MIDQDFKDKTKSMIDDLKTICAKYGLGNSSYEYKIITETFLYKFLNDKFIYELRKIDKNLMNSENIEEDIVKLSDNQYELLKSKLDSDVAKLKKTHFISYLFNRQNEDNFHQLFDETLEDIGNDNIDLFSVQTITKEKIKLFEGLSKHIIEESDKSEFCRAIINKLARFSFDSIFSQSYDFFSVIFEYLIKDYNKDSGKYAEYYTPHSVATIMARILVPDKEKNVRLYDPSAGSGTLILSLAHQIGENKCSIYTQDISQKSNEFLRLNLILNKLVHSLHNIIKGDTLTKPHHKSDDKKDLAKYDYVVSNPPFKMDFSDDRELIANDQRYPGRFFAGVPKVPPMKKDKMPIYQLFIQHILYSLNNNGKAAIVVPTGFCTEKSKIASTIKKTIVDNGWLKAVVQMPPNIFATTGTNVSILFIDKSLKNGSAVLVDASKLGKKIKEGKNQKTLLSKNDEEKIINSINKNEEIEDFSVIAKNEDIQKKNYSFGARQYFTIKIKYSDLTPKEFKEEMDESKKKLEEFFKKSKDLEKEIIKNFGSFEYE